MVLPSFTRTYHHAPYPSIDPTRPELSACGKVVIITGGGTGIGAATALAFAKAKAKAIVILGRRLEPLNSTKTFIEISHSSTRIITHTIDISDEYAISSLFTNISRDLGPLDICINGAGYLSDAGSIALSPLSNFWPAFEINVKGAYIIAQQFLQHASANPVLIGINSLIAHMPASEVEMAPASYATSKIAQAKLYEYVAAENPRMRCYSIHPGVVKSEMSRKSVSMAPSGKENPFEPWDDGELRFPYDTESISLVHFWNANFGDS